MKLLLENWRNFLNEKKWSDYDAPKGQWVEVPAEDIRQAAMDRGGEINIADEIQQLVDIAYKSIGGHLKLKSASDLPGKYTDWLVIDIDDDPEPDATKFSKGNKMSGGGHDGTRAAIDAYLAKTAELLNKSGFYGELSKGAAHIMIKYHNVPFVPTQEGVEIILGGPVNWLGEHPQGKYPGYDGWYTREIGGSDQLKIMLGRPAGVEVVKP